MIKHGGKVNCSQSHSSLAFKLVIFYFLFHSAYYVMSQNINFSFLIYFQETEKENMEKVKEEFLEAQVDLTLIKI